jgi:hypothetical protein
MAGRRSVSRIAYAHRSVRIRRHCSYNRDNGCGRDHGPSCRLSSPDRQGRLPVVTFCIFLDDQVYRFDVDLNQDRSNEVLVSSSLDRDGKQGNVFYVYRAAGDGFERVGQIHLSPSGFYLGKIEELNRYGIVTFYPAGGGTGAYIAYLFDGATISETPLGSIERNPATRNIEGAGIELAAKYSASPSDAIREEIEGFRASHGIKPPETSSFVAAAQGISADELARRYNIKVESMTYRQALEGLIAQNKTAERAATPRPQSAPPSATSPSYSAASDTPSVATASPDSAAAATPRHSIWPWVIGIFAAVVLGFVFWKTQA